MKPTANNAKVVKVGEDESNKPHITTLSLQQSDPEKFCVDMSPSSQCSLDFERADIPSALWTGHYVCSILSTIFCFGPLSVIGLLHFLSAQTDYRLGHTATGLRKKRHAQVWTALAWVFGILVTCVLLYSFCGLSFATQTSATRNTHVTKLVSQKKLKSKTPYVAELETEIRREQEMAERSQLKSDLHTSPMYVAELAEELEKEKLRLETSTIYVAELQEELLAERNKARQ